MRLVPSDLLRYSRRVDLEFRFGCYDPLLLLVQLIVVYESGLGFRRPEEARSPRRRSFRGIDDKTAIVLELADWCQLPGRCPGTDTC